MKIKMKEMNYVFNEEGETTAVEAQYQNYDEGNSFTARVVITDGDLDEMTRSQVDKAAKAKMIEWLQVKTTGTKKEGTKESA